MTKTEAATLAISAVTAFEHARAEARLACRIEIGAKLEVDKNFYTLPAGLAGALWRFYEADGRHCGFANFVADISGERITSHDDCFTDSRGRHINVETTGFVTRGAGGSILLHVMT